MENSTYGKFHLWKSPYGKFHLWKIPPTENSTYGQVHLWKSKYENMNPKIKKVKFIKSIRYEAPYSIHGYGSKYGQVCHNQKRILLTYLKVLTL